MKRTVILLFFFANLMLSCGTTETSHSYLEDLSFDSFLEQSYMALLRTRPELVTELGLDDQLGMSGQSLDPWNTEALKARDALEKEILRLLQNYDVQTLNKKDQLSYYVYEYYLKDLVDGQKFRHHQYLISYMLTSINVSTEQFFTEIHPLQSERDAENYIERLGKVKTKMEEIDRLMAEQEKKEITLPASLLGPTIQNIRNVSRKKSDNLSFYTVFKEKIQQISLSDDRRIELLEKADAACQSSVLPGYKILEERLISQQRIARKDLGVGSLPEGEEYYNFTLNHHTNSNMTGEEIHNQGKSELERIHHEMRNLFEKLNYNQEQSISSLYNRLSREDRQVRGQAIVREHEQLISKAIDWMTPYFQNFPRSEVRVKGDQRGGFYIPPSFDGSRPGTFYASTGSVSYYTLPTLTFHETYPGHHYQIALAGQLPLPYFRRQAMFTGYLEGWALYSEYLMAETGFYDDDIYGRLGHLQAEAFRAARLVIDTGLHLFNWDMNEAINYFAENTGFSKGFATQQVYRYLVWPGQATSYYTGYLAIRDLLSDEKVRLGENFSYKEFHNKILQGGPMPFTILSNEVFHNE